LERPLNMPTEEEIYRASSLSDINLLIAKCQRCSLFKLKNSDVPGSGDARAEVMFIGEAPGKAEDLSGEPFVGAAGKFLDEMLAEIGLDRKKVFIANVLRHRPPQNRDPKPEEIEACWPFLERQIEIIDPKLIIFLGRHSLSRFFPDLKISEVHGQSFNREYLNQKRAFLALYHPAAALYNGGMRSILREDFRKIPKIINELKEGEEK
jgi:uracil-DNA glycosylase